MKQMSVSQFKAHALETFREIGASHEPVLVTRRGKPLAEIRPAQEIASLPGTLADTLIHAGDLVSPLGEEEWEAAQ